MMKHHADTLVALLFVLCLVGACTSGFLWGDRGGPVCRRRGMRRS